MPLQPYRAVLPQGLTEFEVYDVLNIFQCTGLNHDDMYFMKASPAQKGDYLDFFAEIDVLCALSTCPGGDLSLPMLRGGQNPLPVCRPLGGRGRSISWRRDCWKAGASRSLLPIKGSTVCILPGWIGSSAL